MQFMVNSLLEWKDEVGNTRTERVLWVGEETIVVIDINNNDSPYARNLSMMEEPLSNGEVITLEHDTLIVIAAEEEIPQKYKDMRNKAWDAIKDMVIQEPQIFNSSFRRKQLSESAQQHGLSESSVMGYLKRYWKRGMSRNALLPDYDSCGGRGKEKNVGSKKIGRPRKHVDITGEGINVSEEVKRIFRIAINRFYYSKAKNSLVLTFELMRKEYFSEIEKKSNDNTKLVLKPQSEVPTFAQFRYFFEKERDIKKEITSRYSNKKYQKQYRAITGNVRNDVLQPGTFEIDCQVADVYIVSRYNRNWVIGRPALYIVIDKFSNAICGVYIGLETGSYIGAAMAIMNTCIDKVSYCKEFDIDITHEQWPIQGLPQTIIADRGELEGIKIENLINSLAVTVQSAPSYRADWKASVERFFGLTNERTKPFLPGVVDLDGRERGDADYRLKSRLDLYQFSQIIIKCIIFHNNHYYLNHYNREEMMIEDSVPCIPLHLFNWGIANRGGTLRSVPEEVVKLALMPRDTATVTAKGVKFKDMYYASKDMLSTNLFVKARTKGSWRVDISYDPRDLRNIYVHGERINEYEKCFLLEENSRYIDKSLEEVEYLLEMEKIQKIQNKEAVTQAKSQLINDIENIVKQAESDYKKEPEILESDRQRVKNIRENRRLEKAANRKKEVFSLDVQHDKEENEVPLSIHSDESDAVADSVDILFRKQKEGMKKIYGNDKNT